MGGDVSTYILIIIVGFLKPKQAKELIDPFIHKCVFEIELV